MKADAEVVIAGAGPAGSAAALTLARTGRRVLIVERRAFPRDKICGDLIGMEAVAILRRLRIADVALAGATRLTGAVVYGPSGRDAGTPDGIARTARPGDACVLPRAVFDARLLAAAREAGADLATARVLGVIQDARGRVMGVRTDVGDIRARSTIGADGWGSAVGRALTRSAVSAETTAIVARSYVHGVRDLGPRMHFFVNRSGDGYAWLFPLADGSANVGLGFIGGEPGARDLHAAFARFLGPGSPAKRFLADATAQTLATWPIPLGPPRGPVAGPGVFLVGDAARLTSPLSGSGIHHALASGAAAARFALAGRDDDWQRYAGWIRTRLCRRLALERVIHRYAGTPARIEPWLALARAMPGAQRTLSRALLALG